MAFAPLPAKNKVSVPVETFAAKPLTFTGWNKTMRRRSQIEFPVASTADAGGREIEISEDNRRYTKPSKSFAERFPALITGFFFMCFVLLIHLIVGVAYCLVSWAVSLPKRAPIDKELLALLTPVAFCHALGQVISNVSFAAVAVSFTQTIKALEPFFNAAASQFVLGHQIHLSLWLSLSPVVIGVSIASLTQLSFNWTGFISAMISNIAFTYRSIYSKKTMTEMDSTNVYAYISIIALFFCLPPAILIEGPQLMQYGFRDAIAKLATNTLERVAPLTHAVGGVLKIVFVIGFSIVVFESCFLSPAS